MPVMRTYKCDECEYSFDFLHMNRDEDPPACPGCHALALAQQVGTFNIGTNRSRAMKVAEQMMYEDYNMTNMRDNQRAGDVAAISAPPETTAEIDKRNQAISEMTQQIKQDAENVANVPVEIAQAAAGFWSPSGGSGQTPVAPIPGMPTPAGGTYSGPGQQDNVGVLEKARDQGISTSMRLNVMGRSDMPKAS